MVPTSATCMAITFGGGSAFFTGHADYSRIGQGRALGFDSFGIAGLTGGFWLRSALRAHNLCLSGPYIDPM